MAGRDAVKFAHAQFMSDVAALAPGHWQWSGWLTPKGRVIALFALLKLDDETLWLLLPDFGAGELASQLQRYVFRSKLELKPRDDLDISGTFAAPTRAAGAVFARNGESIELDMGADGGARTLRIDATRAADDPKSQSEWLAFDLAHGLPHLPESQREHWTPQQLSLERLKAFSVKKGCYPGQEIVARTHFLGQAKRGLAALCAAKPIPMEAGVELDGAAIGKVVSATPGEPCFALAVLPLDRGFGALTSAGLGLNDIGLRDGLAR
ncbi:folate-binding protein YgfZ [Pseudoluteimonas lycopersici]|uniref:Folate-binding protein YgfZ n=1 Tax=Pseudoluteimonas lycopersici TaxID=1324796 RepID=A0A516V892_9GAMM|nr:folate-binding protein YgfZ [Lysobacter lycopersici]